MNHDIPKIPDHIVEIAEDWPMGLAAYDDGFVILQPVAGYGEGQTPRIKRWDFAAYIPNPLAKRLGELANEKESEQ